MCFPVHADAVCQPIIQLPQSTFEINSCEPFFGYIRQIGCNPFAESHPANLTYPGSICGPGKVTVTLTPGEGVTNQAINPSEELFNAIKTLTNEVQELKKKIGKN